MSNVEWVQISTTESFNTHGLIRDPLRTLASLEPLHKLCSVAAKCLPTPVANDCILFRQGTSLHG